MHCGKFQEGANPNPKGGNPILNIGKANCQGGGGKSIPRGGRKHPLAPPEINPVRSRYNLIKWYKSQPVYYIY